jgi:hypothetical protein
MAWPALSPNLIPSYFFWWSLLKEHFHMVSVRSTEYLVTRFRAGVTTVGAKELKHTYSRECGDNHCSLPESERRPLRKSMLIKMRPSFDHLIPCSIWRRGISQKLMSLMDLNFQ